MLAEKRIKMFEDKLGYKFVANTEELIYERNSPPFEGDESMQISQFEYILGFKNIAKPEEITTGGNQITGSDYKNLYWSIRVVERSDGKLVDKNKIMSLKPISNFMTKIEKLKDRKFNLR